MKRACYFFRDQLGYLNLSHMTSIVYDILKNEGIQLSTEKTL